MAGVTSVPGSGSRQPRADADVWVHDRAYQAHQLRLSGCDWPTIAEQVGYLDGRVAATAVNAYLQKAALEQASDQRRRALELELARLDQIQAVYYRAAVAGDLAAANFVLKVITRRCAILGLDKGDDVVEAPRSIVIGGSSEEYVATLKALVDARHPEPVPR